MDRNFSALKGKIIKKVEGLHAGSDRVLIETVKKRFIMYHSQDCCEHVSIAEIHGDILDIIGSKILSAEVVTDREDPTMKEHHESFLWTFYKLSAIKGSVTIRWLGTSNGYYSESVDFIEDEVK